MVCRKGKVGKMQGETKNHNHHVVSFFGDNHC